MHDEHTLQQSYIVSYLEGEPHDERQVRKKGTGQLLLVSVVVCNVWLNFLPFTY